MLMLQGVPSLRGVKQLLNGGGENELFWS